MDILGGWNGAGCVKCPMKDNREEAARKWLPENYFVEGALAVVVFRGDSLCFAHFKEARP